MSQRVFVLTCCLLFCAHVSLGDEEKAPKEWGQAATASFERGAYDSAMLYLAQGINAVTPEQASESMAFFRGFIRLCAKMDRLDEADNLLGSISRRYTHQELLFHAARARHFLWIQAGDLERAEEYLSELRTIMGTDTLAPQMGVYYFTAGNFYLEKGVFWRSLKSFQKAKELTFNPVIAFSINHNLAIIFEQIDGMEQALSMYQENLAFAIKDENHLDQLYSYFGVASTQVQLKRYAEAKSTCLKAIHLHETYGVNDAFGFIYCQMGEVYRAEQRWDSALSYFRQGAVYSRDRGEVRQVADSYIGLANTYLAMGAHDSAQHYVQLAQDNAFTYSEPLADLQIDLALATGNQQEAFRQLQQYRTRKQETQEEHAAFEVISELLTERMEREKAAEIQDATDRYERQRLYLFLAFLGVGILVLIYVLRRQTRTNLQLTHLNQTLTKRNEALQQFAYITSHDLKEPIRNINLFAGLLEKRREAPLSEREQEYLTFIQKGATNLYGMVNSLKIFTESTFSEVKREAVHVQDVTTEVRQNLQVLLDETGGSLEVSIEEDATYVSFSAPMLLLILQNLVRNGLTYNDSPHPIVRIEAKMEEKQVLFSVSDNGRGIDPLSQELVFQPFKTLQNKMDTGNSGLGLAICRNIIENFGGRIWVTSEKGVGSTFFFTV